jgi:hypothetical protein
MTATYPAFPSWLNPYGATPDAHPCKDGWIMLGLSSVGGDKATFHHRAWRWCYPSWAVVEIPLTERFIHAQLTPIAGRLFVYGLAVGGYCFEEISGFVPYGAAMVLSAEDTPFALPALGSPSPRLFAHELDRMWRRHRAVLKAGA